MQLESDSSPARDSERRARAVVGHASKRRGALMRRVFSVLVLATFGWSATALAAQDPSRPIETNQTDGYGNDRLLAFTYFMNFQCVHEPGDDLDNNGRPAAIDPDEFQSPRCVVGRASKIDPTGKPVANTEPLYVIVPF